MCCFSGSIDKVSKTRIFARTQGSKQLLVYAMDLDTPEDLAMILPIPVAEGTQKIDFLDLSKQNDFFEKVEALFPKNVMKGMTRGLSFGADSKDLLEVHKVGAYDASFVPTVDDMDRLDERFTIKKAIWDELPEYANFGFAVFKLSKGNAERHPMGFWFQSRLSGSLFFPTVHIHDGTIPEEETFDHTLYAQSEGGVAGRWRESNAATASLTKGLQNALVEAVVYKKTIEGTCPNEDTYCLELTT